jgi:hypothetical protein
MPTTTVPFTRFRAEGFVDLDPLEVDGSTMFAVLRGPTDVRKSVLLAALALLRFLLVNGETAGFGPPLRRITPVPFSPDQVEAHGRVPVVILADVVVSPEDLKAVGRGPSVLSLDTIGITLRLTWDGEFPGSSIPRFMVAHGRDFAAADRTVPEMQDLDLAVKIVVGMVDSVLAAARSPRATGVPRPDLNEREQHVVDVVTAYVLDEGHAAPLAEVFLSLPRGKADKEAAQVTLENLVRSGYLKRAGNVEPLLPTLAGLMACARAEEVGGIAERLLDYLAYQAGKKRGRFTQYTLEDLERANVLDHDQLALARVVIAFFRMGSGIGTAWAVPDDIVELRSIDDIRGLLDRCEQLRLRDEASAAAERETKARKEAEAKRQAAIVRSPRERSDETWHRLRDWTQGQTRSEQLAAQILICEGFAGVDPSHPRGGPDGGKDAVCTRDGRPWIMAVYFPARQQEFGVIKKKFVADLRGVNATKEAGIAFVTNQELTLEQREALKKAAHPAFVEIYHLERVNAVLNGPGPDTARMRKLFLDLE